MMKGHSVESNASSLTCEAGSSEEYDTQGYLDPDNYDNIYIYENFTVEIIKIIRV